MMPTTEQDARALTHLAKRLREETHGAGKWDEAGIWSEVRQLIGQNLELTIERVCRHAADPTAKTPGAIRRPFVPPAGSEKPRRSGPPKAGSDEECRQHVGQWATNCATCATDAIEAYNDRPVERMSRDEALAAARAALVAAKHVETEEETADVDG